MGYLQDEAHGETLPMVEEEQQQQQQVRRKRSSHSTLSDWRHGTDSREGGFGGVDKELDWYSINLPHAHARSAGWRSLQLPEREASEGYVGRRIFPYSSDQQLRERVKQALSPRGVCSGDDDDRERGGCRSNVAAQSESLGRRPVSGSPAIFPIHGDLSTPTAPSRLCPV